MFTIFLSSWETFFVNLLKEMPFALMKGFPPSEDKFIDATNWTIYPFNRWGFKNVQRFQPTAFLDNGIGNPTPWQMNPRNLDKLKIKTPDNNSFEIRNLMEIYNTDALVVIHDGKLVYERYWNGMTPTTPHWLASTSKSVVGTAAAILVDRGVLDREKLIKEYIPELAESNVPVFKDTVGWVYYKLGDYQSAIEYLTQVVEQQPDVNVFNYHLGMAYKAAGDIEKAKLYLMKSLENGAVFNGKDKAEEALNSI